MKYFVSADVHGFYDEWQKALNEKGLEINNPEHKIILCGDAFDRGSQAVKIFKFLSELEQQNRLIYIRGNHEDLLFECVKELKENEGCAQTYHYSNGTIDTVTQLKKENLLNQVLEFVNKYSINYYETKNHIFVHGWIPIDICGFYYSNWRNATKELWNKSRWQNPVEMYRKKIFEPNKTIVCGHWHCSALWHELDPERYDEFGEKENFEPFVTENIIALDSCTVHSHKVNVVIIED
jgi:serine/threonine protein phosphatase 1